MTPSERSTDGADVGPTSRLAEVRERIAAACARAERDPADVRLIGVTKTVAPERVAAAREAGLSEFGENYTKDLEAKSRAVPATWHFIGTLQRGTAHRVAEVADVVHSAEPGHAVRRLARRAVELGRVVPCLVQVDLTGERHGVAPDAVGMFLDAVGGLPGIDLIGLMTLPPHGHDPERARPWFARLRSLRDRLAGTAPGLRELSMGMSADYEVAIEEGATMVRVGTALFGARPPRAGSSVGPQERSGA